MAAWGKRLLEQVSGKTQRFTCFDAEKIEQVSLCRDNFQLIKCGYSVNELSVNGTHCYTSNYFTNETREYTKKITQLTRP